MADETVDLDDYMYVTQTQKALLVEDLAGERIWIPKSQIDYIEPSFKELSEFNPDIEVLVVLEWFAEQEGLV